MQTDNMPAVTSPPPRRGMPAILKAVLIVPLVMALLGAEIELSFAPQLDVILTAAGVWAMWAWVAGGISPGR